MGLERSWMDSYSRLSCLSWRRRSRVCSIRLLEVSSTVEIGRGRLMLRTGHDAFQEDPNYKKVSPVPIVKVSPMCVLSRHLADDAIVSSPYRTSCCSSAVSVRCSERLPSIARTTRTSSSASSTSSTSDVTSALKVRPHPSVVEPKTDEDAIRSHGEGSVRWSQQRVQGTSEDLCDVGYNLRD